VAKTVGGFVALIVSVFVLERCYDDEQSERKVSRVDSGVMQDSIEMID
jgi:hypothetical protein